MSDPCVGDKSALAIQRQPVLIELDEIRTGYRGFEKIIGLNRQIKESTEAHVDIDLRLLTWLDANMCSPLGAILHGKEKHSDVAVLTETGQLESVLRKNGFLEQFGKPKWRDQRGTTIEYRRFAREESKGFQEYVTAHFRPESKGLPMMSVLLLKQFRNSLFEIFENAVEHSDTREGIFACGQHYPTQNRLDFCISDLGIGIQEKIWRERQLRRAFP